MSTFSKALSNFSKWRPLEVFSFQYLSCLSIPRLQTEQSLSLLYQATLMAFSKGVHIHNFRLRKLTCRREALLRAKISEPFMQREFKPTNHSIKWYSSGGRPPKGNNWFVILIMWQVPFSRNCYKTSVIDEPACGFQGEKCQGERKYYTKNGYIQIRLYPFRSLESRENFMSKVRP